MSLVIERFANHEILGTPGNIYLDGELIGVTISKPFVAIAGSKGGKPNESCVPDGDYELVDFESAKFGSVKAMVNPELDVFANEEDRDNEFQRFACLLFHAGNYPRNFSGCQGAGVEFKHQGAFLGITDTKRMAVELNLLIRKERKLRIYTPSAAGE